MLLYKYSTHLEDVMVKIKKQDKYKGLQRDEKIRKIVKEIISRKIPYNPYDFIFKDNISPHGETNHKLMNLPGKYSKNELPHVFVDNTAELQMDHLESVLPDGKKIVRDALINLEQQTGPVTPYKANVIFNYCLHTIIRHKKLVYPFVATNHPYTEEYLEYWIEGCKLVIYLRVFDEEKLDEIINTLKNKDFINNEVTEEDYLLFNYCLVFAKKPYIERIIDELVFLFQKMRNISLEYQKKLYSGLCLIIKYHYSDNLDKMEELIGMITDVVYDETLDELSDMDDTTIKMLRKDAMIKKNEAGLLELKRELAQKDETISNKDVVISDYEKDLADQKVVISDYEKDLADQKVVISDQKEELAIKEALIEEYERRYGKLDGLNAK